MLPRIAKFLVLIPVFLIVIFSANQCFATVLNLPPTADAGTKSQFPNNNFGSGSYLYNYNNSGNKGRSYLKFDLSSIPANSTIRNSFLAIYNMANDGSDCNGDPGFFYLSMLDADWSENAITWNNQPNPTANVFMTISCSTNGFVYGDTRYFVQEIVNGNKTNKGFVIFNEMGTNYLRSLLSRESSQKPYLYVLYEAPAPAPTPTPTPTPEPNNPGSSSANSTSATSQAGISLGTKAAPAAKTSTSIKPPTDVIAEDVANSSKAGVKLRWTASESTAIDGYKIFRSEKEKEGFENIAVAEKGILEFVDDTVESGKTYYYFLRSYQASTESESTATVSLSSNIVVTNQASSERNYPLDRNILYIISGATILLLISLLAFYELNWKKKKHQV